jgi:phosphoserine aminotransferase
MSRVYNFSAGPAVLPEEVLKQAAAEMLDYQGCGMSVMEMSHRSKEFQGIMDAAETDLRELMGIPDNYRVIFMQGGATAQFAAIPMNLMRSKVADYIVSGSWSNKAAKEAQTYGQVNVVASSKDDNFSYVPDVDALQLSPDADYVYICQNETITGTTYHKLPDTNGKPLVSDVSSMFLSEPIDVAKYGVIYGGVQKNVGPAGVAIVIARDDLVTDEVLAGTPTILNWKVNADKGSMNNTPPCYTIYMCGLVFKWLKEQGGLAGIGARNREKAQILYDFLDQSKLFKGTARVEDRSIMNVPFITGSDELDAKFCAEAAAHGIANIKGHRSVGGMRASIYNAMPIEGVKALVAYMEQFEKENA